jgi:hypothetical protein
MSVLQRPPDTPPPSAARPRHSVASRLPARCVAARRDSGALLLTHTHLPQSAWAWLSTARWFHAAPAPRQPPTALRPPARAS